MGRKLRAILDELKQRFAVLYGQRLVRMVLYGSHARGDAVKGSDIDVLVVLKGPVNAYDEVSRTGHIVTDLSLQHDEVICCVFVDEDRFATRNGPLLRNVRKEGVAV